MRSSTAVRALAVVAGCLLTAACSGGSSAGASGDPSAPSPVAWSVVQTLASAPTGSYEKRTTEKANGRDQILVSEWVDYDLEKKIIDRRIGLGDDPSTPAVEPAGTRDAPSLRFVLQADGTTMWNPAAKATCGTPWVKMPADQTAGADPNAAFVGVEPTLLLRQVSGTPSVLGNDPTETVYVVGVNGVAGVPTSTLQKQPQIAAELAQQSTPGTVTVARDGKSATLTVDVTNALTKLGNTSGGTVVVSWHLGPLHNTITGPGSAKVADSSCMG
jgi:hypothetical protein